MIIPSLESKTKGDLHMSRYNADVSQLDYSYIRNRNAIIDEGENGSRRLITLEENVARDFIDWINGSCPDGLEYEKIEFETERKRWVVHYIKK